MVNKWEKDQITNRGDVSGRFLGADSELPLVLLVDSRILCTSALAGEPCRDPGRGWLGLPSLLGQFSIEDLKAQPKQTACWDGVRNYQARNFLRAMKLEQEAFFYHSNCKEPGIAGLVKIVKEAYPDHTQFEKNNPHYDPSSKEDNPKWSMVDVQFVRMMKRFITLAELKTHHQAHKATGGPLKNMALFSRQRLSIQPLTQEEFDFILSLEEKEPS
ncbi:thymocyte nuclear protein 1 isoform X2 [Prionailurus viverrinus]|uniref:thymocyte nuclear protein 1 isoform X2 n=1 Tax=Prionailurus viverrinus TaxID=61388 RepID=UPI001FF66D75|nr:thymocyte nuclear protein 1 isoform X2 [Prionailurus viverrinus]